MRLEQALSQAAGFMEDSFAVLPLSCSRAYAQYIFVVAREGKYTVCNVSGSTTTSSIMCRELVRMYTKAGSQWGLTWQELEEHIPESIRSDQWLLFDLDAFVSWHNRRVAACTTSTQ